MGRTPTPWSSGKIGLAGISYYASNQWRVAALQPPHLAAICVWEGYADRYRDSTHHGGIVCTFQKHWQSMQVKTVQHGVGERGKKSRVTAELVCGGDALDEELARSAMPLWDEIVGHALDDHYYYYITWPVRATGASTVRSFLRQLGRPRLVPARQYRGFMRSASSQKWLEVHGTHWAIFYTDYANALQRRFFDHFLKGENNGWDKQPKVLLNVRHPGETLRPAPGARVAARAHAMDEAVPAAGRQTLSSQLPSAEAKVAFEALGDGVTFRMAPFGHDTELTGPVAASCGSRRPPKMPTCS